MYIPATSVQSGEGIEVLPDVFCYTIQIANIVLIGNPNFNEFVLIDAGMPGSSDKIFYIIEERFYEDSKQQAIILTKGHFDHVVSIIKLVKRYNIQINAHPLEILYLKGEKSYPTTDATVEGGMIDKMSHMFPNTTINLGTHIKTLTKDGTVPHLDEFRWIHTPGHSQGHVSLFRENDKTLIAGDAFVTVKQDALYKVLTQEQEISGPPRYLTPDWRSAKESVMKLESLKPTVAVTGHGLPMSGKLLTKSLTDLVENFDQIALPEYGKYVDKDYH